MGLLPAWSQETLLQVEQRVCGASSQTHSPTSRDLLSSNPRPSCLLFPMGSYTRRTSTGFRSSSNTNDKNKLRRLGLGSPHPNHKALCIIGI